MRDAMKVFEITMILRAAWKLEDVSNNIAPTTNLCFASQFRGSEISCSNFVGTDLRVGTKDAIEVRDKKRFEKASFPWKYYCSIECISRHFPTLSKTAAKKEFGKSTHTTPCAQTPSGEQTSSNSDCVDDDS